MANGASGVGANQFEWEQVNVLFKPVYLKGKSTLIILRNLSFIGDLRFADEVNRHIRRINSSSSKKAHQVDIQCGVFITVEAATKVFPRGRATNEPSSGIEVPLSSVTGARS